MEVTREKGREGARDANETRVKKEGERERVREREGERECSMTMMSMTARGIVAIIAPGSHQCSTTLSYGHQDGRPPTHSIMSWSKNREREREREREDKTEVHD